MFYTVSSYLLQAKDERLGTEDLVNLSGFTQSLLDDVSIVIIILKHNNNIKQLTVGETEPVFPAAGLLYLHIVLEDIGGSRHVDYIVDDEFTESCEQVSPFVQSLNLVGFVFFVSLCRHREALPHSNYERKQTS